MNNNKKKLKKKINYTNSIEKNNEIKLNPITSNQINSNEYKFKNIKSNNGYDCIGPCYPANTIYYNPLTLTPIKSVFPSCPINKKEINESGQKQYIFADKCNATDINDEYLYFDIFDESVQIANSSDNFLKQIYNINNIVDVIYYLNNSINELPIYSQKRFLKAIFEVYYKYVEFPKIFFSDRILLILNEIYKINTKISNKQIMIDLDKINLDSLEIYNYFINKYV
jgi:hypothetical protein